MNVLLIDDDVELSASVEAYLSKSQMRVSRAADARAAERLVAEREFDAILLDVMLPDLSGFDVLPKLRRVTRAPIVMLTALGEEDDRVSGLNLGADDYVTKPFSAKELVARLRALRRRRDLDSAAATPLVQGELELLPGQLIVRIGGEPTTLTGAEFGILEQLAGAPNQTISRDLLYRRVLGREASPLDRSLDTHISNLRRKLSAAGARSGIRAVRGVGYVLSVS